VLTLYFAPGSSAMAAHIALHEVGVPFEAVPLSFSKRENRTPAYLALNPEGKVPTLVIDGRPLTEVAGILYYLAKRFPAADLWPDGGVEAEAQAISWMSFIAATLHPARRMGTEHVMKVWTLADQRLGDVEWALGRYSIVDIHLFRLYWRIANSMKPAPATFPNLEAHFERMMARPAVQRTLKAEGLAA
jgi:glutathione S-transferase